MWFGVLLFSGYVNLLLVCESRYAGRKGRAFDGDVGMAVRKEEGLQKQRPALADIWI